MKRIISLFRNINMFVWKIVGKNFKAINISISVRINESGEVEHTFISFMSKNQIPFIMIIKVYIYNGEVNYADCIKSIF